MRNALPHYSAAALLALLLTSTTALAQPHILQQRCLGGSGAEAFANIAPTRDGGYIVLSSTNSSDGDVVGNHKGYGDIWLIKFDVCGEQLWSRCYGGSGIEVGSAVVEAPENGYLFIGSTTSIDGDVKGWHRGANGYNEDLADAWAVRIDSAGGILWQRSLGGTDLDFFHGLCLAHDGGYLVVGGTCSNDGDVKGQHNSKDGRGDAWAIKLSETGAIEWQQTLGGSDHETFTTAAATPDGGYIAVGSTNSNNGDVSGLHRNGTEYSADLWVVKLGGNGTLQWQRCLGGSEFEDPAYLQRILITKDGSSIMLCRTDSKDGDVDPPDGTMIEAPNKVRLDTWIVKLNPDGTLQHQRRLGHKETDDMSGLALLSNGDVIATGCTATKSPLTDEGIRHMDGWIVQLDSTLGVRWEARLGGSDIDNLDDVIALNDTMLVIAGSTRSNDGDVKNRRLKHGPPNWDLWITTVAIGSIKQHRNSIQQETIPVPVGSTLSSIAVMPNPTRGRCALVLPEQFQGNVLVEVINTRGQVVMLSPFSNVGDRLPLDLGNLPVDIYTVAVTRGREKGSAEVTIQR